MENQSVRRTRFQRVTCLMMVLVLLAGILVIPAAAASSKDVSVTSSTLRGMEKQTATVTSGKGLFYSWGWKTTTVSVKNTGRYPVAVYEKIACGLIYKGELSSGRTMSWTMKGSGKTGVLVFQLCRGNKTSVHVTTSAGSVR